ncbi:MAG: uracil-DNA glycosylase, partial [bacterium]
MDAKDSLRRYLEQRRELGETELVLDSLSVDEALKLLGAARSAPRGTDPRAKEPETTDWRAAVRAAGGAPEARPSIGTPVIPDERSRPVAPVSPAAEAPTAATDAESSRPTTVHRAGGGETAAPEVPLDQVPVGLVVGGGGRSVDDPTFKLATLAEVADTVAHCTRCALSATAKNPVPGTGNPDADFMIVGEAPGANEDEQGVPFVGQAGQLLTKILAAINLGRDDVFIANVLKHRPPGNRNPLPEEVVACSPYLVRQIELVRPKVILALGTFAAQTLLETKTTIGKLRGQIHRYYGVPLIVTYHPAALLRNPAWKRPTWEDVQLARRILDRPDAP